MLKDARDVAVTTSNQTALALYEQALTQFHSYFGDPVVTIDQALHEDPDFLLGHIFRATMFLVMTERRFQPEIRASLDAASDIAARGNERERGLLKAAQAFFNGDWQVASNIYEQVLINHPRDAFAAQTAHLLDFYRGDAVNLRDRMARILPAHGKDTPSYSFLLSMHAFGLEECNEFARAEQTAYQALALEPRDPWGIHAIAHVREMQGRHEEGIRLYTEREQDWAPDNGFAFHNWWHLALYYMERDEYDKVLAIYDQHIAPEPDAFILGLIDATAMLWRLKLHGIALGARWQTVAELWAERHDNGFYAFNDTHAMLAYCGAGELEAGKRLLSHIQGVAQDRNGSSNTLMTREVGLPVSQAIFDYAHGRYAQAVERLTPVRAQANRFGGSNAQRDILNQTLIDAAIRAGQHRVAEHLLNERLARKPHSPLAWRYVARNLDASGKTDEAGSVRRRAVALPGNAAAA